MREVHWGPIWLTDYGFNTKPGGTISVKLVMLVTHRIHQLGEAGDELRI